MKKKLKRIIVWLAFLGFSMGIIASLVWPLLQGL